MMLMDKLDGRMFPQLLWELYRPLLGIRFSRAELYARDLYMLIRQLSLYAMTVSEV